MSLYDPIRQAWVKADPEERVRQQLVQQLIDLGYPQSLIGVEKELRHLPHLSGEALPSRRVDLICFGKGVHPEHPLYPLLMIEVKAITLNDRVKRQVAGYNAHVGAYYIAVANEEQFLLGWFDGQQYQWQEGLPSYQQLIECCTATS